jgi:hypothetical protein
MQTLPRLGSVQECDIGQPFKMLAVIADTQNVKTILGGVDRD